MESKSKQVAGYAGVFLFSIITLYPTEQIQKLGTIIQQFLKWCITNANPDCRSNARKAFLIWQVIDHDSAEQLYGQLDAGTQRAIQDEEDHFQV